MKELITIQQNLNAPKDKYNSFGKYNYRSAEGIIENVKPLLFDLGCTLTLTDECVNVCGNAYIKATATITNSAGESVSACGYAREENDKKGMDASQMTGTASSYARKYAMNGLFAIDDGKDADTDEYANERANTPQQQAHQTSEKKDNSDKPWWSNENEEKKQRAIQWAIEQGRASALYEYYRFSKDDFAKVKQIVGK